MKNKSATSVTSQSKDKDLDKPYSARDSYYGNSKSAYDITQVKSDDQYLSKKPDNYERNKHDRARTETEDYRSSSRDRDTSHDERRRSSSRSREDSQHRDRSQASDRDAYYSGSQGSYQDDRPYRDGYDRKDPYQDANRRDTGRSGGDAYHDDRGYKGSTDNAYKSDSYSRGMQNKGYDIDNAHRSSRNDPYARDPLGRDSNDPYSRDYSGRNDPYSRDQDRNDRNNPYARDPTYDGNGLYGREQMARVDPPRREHSEKESNRQMIPGLDLYEETPQPSDADLYRNSGSRNEPYDRASRDARDDQFRAFDRTNMEPGQSAKPAQSQYSHNLDPYGQEGRDSYGYGSRDSDRDVLRPYNSTGATDARNDKLDTPDFHSSSRDRLSLTRNTPYDAYQRRDNYGSPPFSDSTRRDPYSDQYSSDRVQSDRDPYHRNEPLSGDRYTDSRSSKDMPYDSSKLPPTRPDAGFPVDDKYSRYDSDYHDRPPAKKQEEMYDPWNRPVSPDTTIPPSGSTARDPEPCKPPYWLANCNQLQGNILTQERLTIPGDRGLLGMNREPLRLASSVRDSGAIPGLDVVTSPTSIPGLDIVGSSRKREQDSGLRPALPAFCSPEASQSGHQIPGLSTYRTPEQRNINPSGMRNMTSHPGAKQAAGTPHGDARRPDVPPGHQRPPHRPNEPLRQTSGLPGLHKAQAALQPPAQHAPVHQRTAAPERAAHVTQRAEEIPQRTPAPQRTLPAPQRTPPTAVPQRTPTPAPKNTGLTSQRAESTPQRTDQKPGITSKPPASTDSAPTTIDDMIVKRCKVWIVKATCLEKIFAIWALS